jgi:ParB family chromosome partitioning protein
MSKTKPGLGRGLDALINPKVKDEVDNPLSVSSDEIKKDDGQSVDVLAKIPTDKIDPNPFQPRTEFDEEALDELKKSILENGLIQPITVRRMEDGRYQLISGERRLRACKDIGYKEIPSYIVQVDSKEAMLALSLIENIQREKLNAIEVAEAYKRLLEECRLSQEEVAKKLGKNRTTITNSIRLLKLPKTVRESIAKEEISAGHARALINLPSEDLQVEVVNKIKKDDLSVRKVENLVKKYINNKEQSKNKRVQDKSDKTKETHQKDLESKLRTVFGTKVLCKQRENGAGEITIEFYSNDELERLLELFEVIEKADY